MKKFTLCVVLLVVGSVFAFGCKKAPEDQMLGHMDKIIGLLEANKEDPAKAAEAITAYAKDNEAGLKALMEELAKAGADMSPEDQKKRGEAMKEKMGPLMARIATLQKDHSDLFSNPKVLEAMTALGPMMGGM